MMVQIHLMPTSLTNSISPRIINSNNQNIARATFGGPSSGISDALAKTSYLGTSLTSGLNNENTKVSELGLYSHNMNI